MGERIIKITTGIAMPVSETSFKCKVCCADTDLASDDGETFCHEHCPDHDYQNDTLSDYPMCLICGEPAPDDFYEEQPGDDI